MYFGSWCPIIIVHRGVKYIKNLTDKEKPRILQLQLLKLLKFKTSREFMHHRSLLNILYKNMLPTQLVLFKIMKYRKDKVQPPIKLLWILWHYKCWFNSISSAVVLLLIMVVVLNVISNRIEQKVNIILHLENFKRNEINYFHSPPPHIIEI